MPQHLIGSITLHDANGRAGTFSIEGEGDDFTITLSDSRQSKVLNIQGRPSHPDTSASLHAFLLLLCDTATLVAP